MQGLLCIDGLWPRKMGGPIAHHERDRLTSTDVEFTDSLQIFAAERRRRPQDHSFGTTDSRYPAVWKPLDPRHDRAIVETQNELGLHRDATAHPSDQPHDIRVTSAQTDEIDHLGCTLGSLEHRHENQRAVQITALELGRTGRSAQPANDHVPARRGARQNMLPNRTAEDRASRWIHCARPAPPSCSC